jgi:hypothetical protein
MRAMPAWPDVPGITADPAGASRGIAAMGRSYGWAVRIGSPRRPAGKKKPRP